MPHPKTKAICIEEPPQQAHLSPAQKKFNELIQKIDAQNKLLSTWQETIPQCQQDKIEYLITSLCEELISQHGRDDLKPIYDYYSGHNYDDAIQENNELVDELLKSMFEKELGVELDDDEFDFSNPEETAAHLKEKMQEHQKQAEEFRAKRKKSAKQLAREAREKEEEAATSKSIQAVYRQLVAALHPDRELDPMERERKTELMQKVTVAYGKKDLLQLLELQMNIEQIDQREINHIAEDRLKQYNAILQKQLTELRHEVKQMEIDIRRMTGLAPHEHLSPKRFSTLLDADIRMLRTQINRMQHNLRLFSDVTQFKIWLKSYHIPEPEFDSLFDDF